MYNLQSLRKVVIKVLKSQLLPQDLKPDPFNYGIEIQQDNEHHFRMAGGLNEHDDEIPTTKLKEEPQW